jgi:hypothetical protein
MSDARPVLQYMAMGLDPNIPDQFLLVSALQTARQHARECGQPLAQERGKAGDGSSAQSLASSGERKESREVIRLNSVCPPPGLIDGPSAVRRAQTQQQHAFLAELLEQWRRHSMRVRA